MHQQADLLSLSFVVALALSGCSPPQSDADRYFLRPYREKIAEALVRRHGSLADTMRKPIRDCIGLWTRARPASSAFGQRDCDQVAGDLRGQLHVLIGRDVPRASLGDSQLWAYVSERSKL